jgi:hypothetical protein
LEFYVDDQGQPVVREWLRSLSLTKRQVLGSAMNEVLQHKGIDVCGTEFGRQLGQGLFEFRLRLDPKTVLEERNLPPEKILLRVFCHAYGTRVVLLLGGYDKAEDSSKSRQAGEIATARGRLTAWRLRQRKRP